MSADQTEERKQSSSSKDIKNDKDVSTYVSKHGSKQAHQRHEGGHKRILQGVVVSDKMQKTIVVKVDRRVKHSRYMKFQTLSKKYKAHDEKEQANVGDRVEIIESRPISKEKHWALRRVLERSLLQQGEV